MSRPLLEPPRPARRRRGRGRAAGPDGDLAGTRVYRAGYDDAQRREAADFVRAKGDALRPVYVALCLACWVRDHAARDRVSGADVRALFPPPEDGRARPPRNPTDLLRRARNDGLLESIGEGWYRVAPLGAAVVEVLPDLAAVAALLGRATAKCAARRGAWSGLR